MLFLVTRMADYANALCYRELIYLYSVFFNFNIISYAVFSFPCYTD